MPPSLRAGASGSTETVVRASYLHAAFLKRVSAATAGQRERGQIGRAPFASLSGGVSRMAVIGDTPHRRTGEGDMYQRVFDDLIRNHIDFRSPTEKKFVALSLWQSPYSGDDCDNQ